jgi:hypothetical protein
VHMTPRRCPHPQAIATEIVCAHLLEPSPSNRPSLYRHRLFTGQGLEFHWLCSLCVELEDPAPLVSVCESCRERVWRESDMVGNRGSPEVLERSTNLGFVHEQVELSRALPDVVVAVESLEESTAPQWSVLLATGDIVHIDDHGEVSRRATLIDSLGLDCSVRSWLTGSLTEEEREQLAGEAERLHPLVDVYAKTGDPDDRAQAQRYWDVQHQLRSEIGVLFRVAGDGSLAVVCQRRGLRGVVLDLATGDVAMELAREDYHAWACTFPVAFFRDGGRHLLVHSPTWNRLDITDPSMGELLTPRAPTSYRRGEEPPIHYLDYFHGALSVSPEGTWIADDGWIWHPWGEVVTWSLRRWLEDNAWESEDGQTKRRLADAEDYWDRPVCWLDEETLAIYGYGEDEYWIIPAARIYDVVSGDELRWFPGPAGRFFSDRYLYSVHDGMGASGTSVWDVETGERLHQDAAFTPHSHHRRTGTFLTIRPPEGMVVSRLDRRPS